MASPVIRLSVSLCFFLTEVFGLHSGYFPDLEEVASSQVLHTTLANRHKRSGDINDLHKPDFHEINTQILGLNNDVTFRFKPVASHHISPIAYKTSSGDLKRHNTTKINCTWVYEDVSGEAHAVVDTCDPEKGFSLIAELYLDGTHHMILPKDGPSETGRMQHALYKMKNDIDFLDDYAYFDDDLETEERKIVRKKRGTATTSYTVEFMIILDYTVYDYWFRMTSASLTSVQRDAEAMTRMQDFYSYIARAMDYRYKKIPTLNIGVELNEIYVLKSIAASSMTVKPSHVSGVKDDIDANTTLFKLIDWVAIQVQFEDGFINTDHYQLYTNQDLSLLGNSGAAGFAAFEKICTSKSVSVVEGRFHFMTAILGAHELGHSLGGRHDGDGNTCSKDDYYVLAPTNSVRTGAEKNNPFQFSTCSAAEFTALIADLDAKNINCLVIDGVTQVVAADSTEIGQFYSPDVQCQRVFGANSRMWRYNNLDKTTLNYNKICTAMACIVGNGGRVMIPADGTSCGSGKWCQNGECVASSEVPTGNDECYFGDQPGEVSVNITCQSLLDAHLGRCYEETIRHQCCASCESKKLSITDCTYGDRNDCSAMLAAGCYTADIASKCCKTCNDYRVQYNYLPTECQYGDKATGCTITSCRSNKELCCGTCSSAKPAPDPQTTTAASGGSGGGGSGSGDTTTSGTTQTDSGGSSIPDWAIPVAGALGGLVALVLLGLLAYYIYTKRKSGSKRGRRYDDRRSRDKRRHERNRSPERRYDPYGGRNFSRY